MSREIRREHAIEQAAERAAVLFRMFGWEYYDGVPTASRIEDVICELYDSLDKNGGRNISSGRICVRKYPDGGEDIFLHLAEVYPDE